MFSNPWCLFSHARTRLRGADREGTCSCEGAEFLWWCAVELGIALYLIVPLKGVSVTYLARVRHRGGCLWLRSMWQYDWRSCPAHFDSMLCAVCNSVYLVFTDALCGTADRSEEHLDVHQSSLRRVSLAARLSLFVLSLIFCLHFALGGRRFSDKCTRV